MSTIGPRPTAPRPSPTAPQADTRPTATAKTAATNAVSAVQQSSFEAPVTKAAAAQPMPGAWRGGPDTEVGKAIAGMINRMRSSEWSNIQIKGDTPESL